MIDRQLELALRADLAAPDDARAAALAFLDEFDPALPLDARVYAALPAVQTELGRAQTDDSRATLIAGAIRRIWTHNQLCLAAMRDALDVLARVGVTPIVLPGALTAIAALDDPRLRMVDRIDVLVEQRQLSTVATALLATGATIEQDTQSLVDARWWPPHFDATLAHGTLVVHWQLLPLRQTSLDGWRAHAREPFATTMRADGLAAADAVVAALVRLDSEPSPTEWTNLVLELGRLGRTTLINTNAGEVVARVAYDVGRHEQWSSFLELVGHLSGDIRIAERYNATPQPASAPPPRSTTGRARRMLREYRSDARARSEPITARGLTRYLARRWRLPSLRDVPREVARRVARPH